jgi:hypothetical protein
MQWFLARWYTLVQATQLWMLRLWVRRTLRTPAQGLVEYGLILVLVMVVCVAILTTTGRTISSVWYNKLVNNPALNP